MVALGVLLYSVAASQLAYISLIVRSGGPLHITARARPSHDRIMSHVTDCIWWATYTVVCNRWTLVLDVNMLKSGASCRALLDSDRNGPWGQVYGYWRN